MDAMASEVQRKGDAFMAKWAEIMTCMQPKTYFFRSAHGQVLGVQGLGVQAGMQWTAVLGATGGHSA
jgi:hypothetical protein